MSKENFPTEEEQVTTASQEVLLFEGPDTGKQEVAYYHDQDWFSIIHDGQEMNMKRENWDKLVALAAQVVPKSGG